MTAHETLAKWVLENTNVKVLHMYMPEPYSNSKILAVVCTWPSYDNPDYHWAEHEIKLFRESIKGVEYVGTTEVPQDVAKQLYAEKLNYPYKDNFCDIELRD